MLARFGDVHCQCTVYSVGTARSKGRENEK